ncbi:MAG: 16S rRNA (guanine(966)-N(2))-methyltransferase RsmD [Rhodobacteraceae bacterium]|nr:16S rRNA (guanine(966)-N(2))-methyltransferase RsmD [Paracoccaceae bacterium]
MRIIGGQNRGTVLAELGRGDERAHLRPTPDRVREALFSMLLSGRYGNAVQDTHVLDLFAGTGALGLEALSRGAAFASFVDNGRTALDLIAKNIAKTRQQDSSAVLNCAAAKLPPNTQDACDLVFLDPPYGAGLGAPALTSAKTQGWVAPGALIIWEETSPQPAPPGFVMREYRRYGASHITILEAVND